MITHQDAQHLLNDVEYIKGWKLMWMPLSTTDSYMYWYFRDETGTRHNCRKWLIELPDATESDIIQTALRAVLDAAEHEVRETFRFKGKRIYGPHFSPDALVDFARYKKNLNLKNDTPKSNPEYNDWESEGGAL